MGFALLALWAAAPAAAQSGPVLESVAVDGLPEAQARELLGLLPAKKGRPLEPGQQRLAREVALSFAQNRGWLEAEAVARAEIWTSSAALLVTVRAGPLYRFGRTRFVGLAKLPERELRRDLGYDPGDPYERPRLLRAQARLFGLGFFEDIDVEVATTTAKTAEVTVRARERPLKWVKTGVGWGSEDRERLSLTLTHHNLFRRAYTGELAALYTHVSRELRGEFVNRHWFGTDAEQRSTVLWRREDRQGYDLERAQGQFGLATALSRRWRLTTAYKISRTVLYQVAPDISASEPTKPLQSGALLGFDYDATDDALWPSRGSRAALLLERQGGALGGDVDLNRASTRGSAFWSPARGFVGAAGAGLGVVRQFRPSESVPIFERYFMGGASTVRGYRERDIGPKDGLGSPLGGNVFSRGTVEARFPIYKRLSGAAFLDGGMVSPRERLIWPARWKWGAGPGLRLRTPVGPVRLDAGWKVNPEPDVARWVFHFSLGEAF